MKVFDVFDPELDVHRPFLLEASAGTGKTFSIENIVVRGLLDDPKNGNGPLSIKDILVVTFTKAAAKELKIRILQNLQKAAGRIQDPKALERIKRALIEFDLANISTIHSFCYRALLEHATVFRLNKNPDDLSQDRVWKVLERHFHTQLSQTNYTPKQLQILLKPHKNSISLLSRDLIKTFARGISFAKTESNSTCLLKLKDLKGDVSLFEKYAYHFYSVCEGKTKNIKPEYLKALNGLYSHKIEPYLEELVESLSLFSLTNLKKSSGPLREDAMRFFCYIEETVLPLVLALGNYDHLFARLASECQKAVFTDFEATETCDFSYLLVKMDQLISTDPDFKSRLKSRYKMAIIDEFQDTDPIQWKIFKSLFSDQKFPFILVGDPKQSIYAFRSADIYTYLSAASSIDPNSQYLLSTNYRSSPELITALNRLFDAETAPGWIALPALKKYLPYIPVQAPVSKHSKNSNLPALHFFHVASDLKLEQIEQEFLFPRFLQEVERLQKKIPLSQIAFLVRDHLQSDRLFRYFQSKKLPAIQKRSLTLDQAVILQDLIYLLRAISSPRRLSYVQIALGTQFFSWTSQELETLKDQNLLSRVLIHFHKWNATWNAGGIAAMIETFLSSPFLNEKTLQESLLESFEGLNRYHELRQIIEWLAEKESTDSLSPLSVIEELESIQSIEQSNQENLKMRPLLDKEAVQILTLHASKGLEFDVVFALGVINRPKSDKGLILVREDDSIVLKAVQQTDPKYLDCLEENDAEKSRQLYVALTRAKSHLYIPCVEGWKAPPLGGASPLELWLARVESPGCSWKELYTRLATSRLPFLESLCARSNDIKIENLIVQTCENFVASDTPIDLVPPRGISLNLAKRWNLSFTSLSKNLSSIYTEETPPHDFTAPIKTRHTLPAGSYTGEFLHQILEEIPFSLIQSATSSQDLQSFIHRFTANTLFKSWESVISEMIYDAFKTPILPHGMRLDNLNETNCFREMEFVYPTELAGFLPECRNTQGNINGVIDLFFMLDGKYYLLDWKTNWLGKSQEAYTPSRIQEAMIQNRYDLQSDLYIQALKAYLGKTCKTPFEEVFGGTIYFFLRGNAVFHDQ